MIDTKEDEVLFDHKNFSLVKRERKTGVKMKLLFVAVLPYTVDEAGLISTIGVLHEHNPFREGAEAKTLITGTVDFADDDLLDTAIRELWEEGGFKVEKTELQRFTFLGNLNEAKTSDKRYPVFAINVTDLKQEAAPGDGSEGESKSELKMVPTPEAIQSEESILLAAFLKLFNFCYTKMK